MNVRNFHSAKNIPRTLVSGIVTPAGPSSIAINVSKPNEPLPVAATLREKRIFVPCIEALTKPTITPVIDATIK